MDVYPSPSDLTMLTPRLTEFLVHPTLPAAVFLLPVSSLLLIFGI